MNGFIEYLSRKGQLKTCSKNIGNYNIDFIGEFSLLLGNIIEMIKKEAVIATNASEKYNHIGDS